MFFLEIMSTEQVKVNMIPAGYESSDDGLSDYDVEEEILHTDACLKLRDKLDTLGFECKCPKVIDL